MKNSKFDFVKIFNIISIRSDAIPLKNNFYLY